MKKLIIIDASSLNNAGCLRKFWLSNIQGYRSSAPNSVQIEYGSAFHIFKQVYDLHKNADLALACASNYFTNTPMTYPKGKDWMTGGHLIQTCEEYLLQPEDKFKSVVYNGKALVEQTVSIPYYTDDKHEIILAGTIDDLKRSDCYLIEDVKTTGTWEIRKYLDGYAMSHQLMFYRLMVSWLGEHRKGIWEEINRSPVGCAIYGVFLKKAEPAEFRRSEVFFFTEQRMAEFESMLKRFIARIVAAHDQIPEPEGIISQTCQGRFEDGKCPFFKACSAPDEISTQHIVNAMFTQATYNPMNFRSLTPEILTMINTYEQRKANQTN